MAPRRGGHGHAHHHHHRAQFHHHHGHSRARPLSPEWVKYEADCNEYAKKLTYPPQFEKFRIAVIVLVVVNLISNIVFLATPGWIVEGNQPLAMQVIQLEWSSYSAASYAGSKVTIGVGGVDACKPDAIISMLCKLSAGDPAISDTKFGPALSGSLAMIVLAFVGTFVGLLLTLIMSWPVNGCCGQGSRGLADPWKLKWILGMTILYSCVVVLQFIATVVLGAAVPEAFVAQFPSYVTRPMLKFGPAIAFGVIGIIASLIIVIIMRILNRVMGEHAKSVEMPPMPTQPTGPMYLADAVMAQMYANAAAAQNGQLGVPMAMPAYGLGQPQPFMYNPNGMPQPVVGMGMAHPTAPQGATPMMMQPGMTVPMGMPMTGYPTMQPMQPAGYSNAQPYPAGQQYAQPATYATQPLQPPPPSYASQATPVPSTVARESSSGDPTSQVAAQLPAPIAPTYGGDGYGAAMKYGTVL